LQPRDQVLEIDLAGRDPDDGCTLVPYEKGALFLTALEQSVGRERFDGFLRSWFDRFAFRSVGTADLVACLERVLPDAAAAVPVREWLSLPGVPPGAPEPRSDALGRVDASAAAWKAGGAIDTSRWSTQEWLRFLRTVAAPLERLDREFGFTRARNAEVRAQWLLMAAREGYEPALGGLEEFLVTVGRRKYIKPLYAELAKTPEGRARAAAIYEKARPGYHPIARATVDQVLSA
jgi:leukotriene-A4 hydrolase